MDENGRDNKGPGVQGNYYENYVAYYSLQTATFCGQQGRIFRPVRAILSGQF